MSAVSSRTLTFISKFLPTTPVGQQITVQPVSNKTLTAMTVGFAGLFFATSHTTRFFDMNMGAEKCHEEHERLKKLAGSNGP